MPTRKRLCLSVASAVLLGIASCGSAFADSQVRARDLGAEFPGTPGPYNAITDVPDVEVGHATIIRNESADGTTAAIRTGVTAVFPKGREYRGFVYAGFFSLNGTGEMTGRSLIEEVGMFAGPVMTTGTTSVGVVRDSVIGWYRDSLGADDPALFQYIIPVVGETYDGNLSDIYGFHVDKSLVFEALDSATGGPVAEGNVGGGTGAISFAFKGGIGTSSRQLPAAQGGYRVGVLVQSNFGVRHQLTISGVPVGREISGYQPVRQKLKDGSIIAVVATDAPLLPHQLERLARRASHGMARTGGLSGNTSGDLFLAFSTAVPEEAGAGELTHSFVDTWAMNPLLEAVAFATEEAIVNALVAAETLDGVRGNKVFALPHDRLREELSRYRPSGRR